MRGRSVILLIILAALAAGVTLAGVTLVCTFHHHPRQRR